jgi:hypothetical protein
MIDTLETSLLLRREDFCFTLSSIFEEILSIISIPLLIPSEHFLSFFILINSLTAFSSSQLFLIFSLRYRNILIILIIITFRCPTFSKDFFLGLVDLTSINSVFIIQNFTPVRITMLNSLIEEKISKEQRGSKDLELDINNFNLDELNIQEQSSTQTQIQIDPK